MPPDVLLHLCHCGHHRDTHHEGVANCTGIGCNDCDHYRDRTQPDTRKPQKPADHPDWCRCYGCVHGYPTA